VGEVWLERGGQSEAAVSQPHVWEQVLFYLASLEAWPPASAAAVGPSCGGVVEALEAQRASPPVTPSRSSQPSARRRQQLPATGGEPFPPELAAAALGAALVLRITSGTRCS